MGPMCVVKRSPVTSNSNSIGNSRATGLSVEDCCVSPSSNKVDLFILFIYLLTYLFTYLFIYLFIYLEQSKKKKLDNDPT